MGVTCHTEEIATKVFSGEKQKRALYISWSWLRRADSIAASLGIPSYTVKYFRAGLPMGMVLVKYFLQVVHTFCLLLRRRPRVVFVTNPPIFAAIPVYAYCLLFRARYVVDSHSGCFTIAHWQKLTWMQKFFSKRAAFSLVHNSDNAKVLDEWGVDYEVFPSLPPELEVASQPRDGERPLVVFICSHNADEPLDEFFGAAELLQGFDFRVTGRAPKEVQENHPENVALTGYLTEAEYLALLVEADLLVALTTEEDTLLYGAQEAISLHKPLVISDTSTLRNYFPEGTVFTANEAQPLARSMQEAVDRRTELAGAMAAFEACYRQEGRDRVERVRQRTGL